MTTLALVVLDSVRADRFARAFDWLPGRRFAAAYSTANWTAPAHASLLAGRYGSEVGVLPSSPSLSSDVSYLPARLREAGYETRGLSANPFFSARFGWDRGFEAFRGPHSLKNPSGTTYFDWNPYTATPEDGPLTACGRYLRGVADCLRSDADTRASLARAWDLKTGGHGAGSEVDDDGAGTVLDAVREWDPGEDAFLVVNLMEAHVPYAPPAPHWTGDPVYLTARHALLDEAAPPGATAAYDAAVAYLSERYRAIFDALAERCEYVVTCADHGELLGEHGGRWNHVYGVYPELTHVPLVVSGAGLGGVEHRTVSLLDVHRTLASLAGVDVASRGQSLLDGVTERDRLAEYRGLIDLARRRLREGDGADAAVERFDRSLFGLCGVGGRYAYQTADGWTGADGAPPGDAAERAEALRADLRDPPTEEPEGDLDAATRRRLEDLGYV